jgi:nucleoside-diphosphate kinase
MTERTFAIIKPDAVAARHTGDIVACIERNQFTILHMQKVLLSREKAEAFYAVHKARPFFAELVEYMISGPIVVMALERDNAIESWRMLMGATNPANAQVGTLRYMFGTSIGSNATHGSDSAQTAASELALFFPDMK